MVEQEFEIQPIEVPSEPHCAMCFELNGICTLKSILDNSTECEKDVVNQAKLLIQMGVDPETQYCEE